MSGPCCRRVSSPFARQARWRLAVPVALVASLAGAAHAADQPAAGDVAQANNPLANFTAFNLHNYCIGELTDTAGE
jgi:hypothetical protein